MGLIVPQIGKKAIEKIKLQTGEFGSDAEYIKRCFTRVTPQYKMSVNLFNNLFTENVTPFYLEYEVSGVLGSPYNSGVCGNAQYQISGTNGTQVYYEPYFCDVSGDSPNQSGIVLASFGTYAITIWDNDKNRQTINGCVIYKNPNI